MGLYEGEDITSFFAAYTIKNYKIATDEKINQTLSDEIQIKSFYRSKAIELDIDLTSASQMFANTTIWGLLEVYIDNEVRSEYEFGFKLIAKPVT